MATIRSRTTVLGINGVEKIVEGEPEEIKEVPWPDSCALLWQAWIVERDQEKAYKIALKYAPNIAHIYKPDDGTEIDE